MSALMLELKQAVRGIIDQPAFASLVVGVLAAGLTCVIYMLIAIGSLVMRPLPFPEPQNLHYIGIEQSQDPNDTLEPMRSDDLTSMRRHLFGRAAVGGFSAATVNLSDLDRPERFDGAFVSGNLFSVLGVAPMLGRDFSVEDEREGASAKVMLSHDLWKQRYAGDPAIVGRQLRVNAELATVIGVMPEDFSYPRRERVWVAGRLVEGSNAEMSYTVVLRRAPATSASAIDTAVARWFSDASRAEPDHFRGVLVTASPLTWLAVNRTTRAVLGVMLTAVLLVLLVACANAANLLLTRTLGRRHEDRERRPCGDIRRADRALRRRGLRRDRTGTPRAECRSDGCITSRLNRRIHQCSATSASPCVPWHERRYSRASACSCSASASARRSTSSPRSMRSR